MRTFNSIRQALLFPKYDIALIGELVQGKRDYYEMGEIRKDLNRLLGMNKPIKNIRSDELADDAMEYLRISRGAPTS